MTQRKLYIYTAIWTVMGFTGLCGSMWLATTVPVASGIFAVLTIWMCSIFVMYLWREKYEAPKAPQLLDLKKGSWAFLLGNTIFLPLAAVCAVTGWHNSDFSNWGESPNWMLACLGIGLVAGGTFHLLDCLNYRQVGAGLALMSPTKVAYDFITYPVLFGGLVYAGTPMLLNWNLASACMAICIVIWAFLCMRDMVYSLNPKDLHPAWYPEGFRSLEW